MLTEDGHVVGFVVRVAFDLIIIIINLMECCQKQCLI